METNTELSMLDYRLLRIDFSLNPHFGGNQGQVEVQTEFKIRHEWQPPHLKVFLTISFNDNSGPFNLSTEGVGLFHVKTTCDDRQLDLMVNQQCSTLLFPYLRELIADITRRAGFPPLHIPHVDFARVFDRKSREIIAQRLN